MKKKLLLLLVAVAMMLTAFAVSAGAAGEISVIGIENLRAPLGGNSPDYYVTLVNGNLVAKQNNPVETTGGIVWYELVQRAPGTEPLEKIMRSSDVFETGKTYRFKMFLMPFGAAEYANSVSARIYSRYQYDEPEVYRTAKVFTPTGNKNNEYKVVVCDFKCEKEAIASVIITDLELPEAGKLPDVNCTVATDGVYINMEDAEVQWHYNLSAVDPSEPFVAGRSYNLTIFLRTDFEDGYWFKTDSSGENIARIYINGLEYGVTDTGEYDHIRNVEYDYYVPHKNITNIGIEGVATPVAGMKPDFTAVPTTAGYDILEVAWVNDTLMNELTTNGGLSNKEAYNLAKLTEENGKVFEAGNEYRVTFEVAAQKDYEINYDPLDEDVLDYIATVNGNEAKKYSARKGENASIYYVFGKPLLQPIYHIDVTGIDAPVAGNVPDYEGVCGDDSYKIADISWIDLTRVDELKETGLIQVEAEAQSMLYKGDGKTFKAGHKYKVSIEVEPEKNYEINYDADDYNILYFAATVNGEDAKEHNGYKGANADFSYVFEHTCVLNPIARVEATCRDKGKEAYFMCPCGNICEDAAGTKPIIDIDEWGIIPVNANNHTYKDVVTKATLTANGKIESKCVDCEDVRSKKTIYLPKTFALSAEAFVYNGKAQTPTVTVKDSKGITLVKGVDYKLTYESGRKNPGKYTIRIDFIGKYEGTKRVYYTIAPKAAGGLSAVTSISAIKLSWKKVTGADGYRVYMYNAKTKKWDTVKTVSASTVSYKITDLKAGTKYKFRIKAYKKDDGTIWSAASATFETATRCKTPAFTKLVSSKGKAVFTWTDVSGESGYQVYYSTKKDSGFKKVASYKANVLSGSKSSLTSGKTYYFMVRAYIKTDSGVIYSAWSTVKSVKIK